MVKKLKRSLEHSYNRRGLDQQEFTTAIKRVACIINSRPVSARMGPCGGANPDFVQALTPNMMLLGRTGKKQVMREYEDTSKVTERIAYVCEIERAWFNQWRVQAFTSLIPTQKWVETKRNMVEGDVVLIHYTSVVKAGTFRIGRVVLVEVDADQLVRTVIVKYSLLQNLSQEERLS